MYKPRKINDTHLIINPDLGIETLDDADLFNDMLKRFEPETLNPCLERLKKGIEESDDMAVRKEAHTLKGSSGYIAATALSETAKEMQFAMDKKDIKKGYELYPILIATAIETKIEIKKYTCIKNQMEFQEEGADYEVPIAKGYKWQKNSRGDIEVIKDYSNNIIKESESKHPPINIHQASEEQFPSYIKKSEDQPLDNVHRNNHTESKHEFPSNNKNYQEIQKNSKIFKAKQSGGIIEEEEKKKEENFQKANNYNIKNKSKLSSILENNEKSSNDKDQEREISERNFENYNKISYDHHEEPIQNFDELEEQRKEKKTRGKKNKYQKKSSDNDEREENIQQEIQEDVNPSYTPKKNAKGSPRKKKMVAEKASKEGGSCCCVII